MFVSMTTKAGERLKAVLKGQPFHLMYEESKKSGVPNLNPLLREKLRGQALAYPTISGATCDVVFSLGGVLGVGSERLWVEAKLVQTHNGGNRDDWRFEDRNGNFEKHLGLKDFSHHSAVRDVRDRLPTLDGHSSADRIGFLMVAYHSRRYPIAPHIPEFERIGGISGWEQDLLIDQADPRKRAKAERGRITVYYWERRTNP